PMMSVPMRSQSGASGGSSRIQLWRSVAPGGKGVPGGTIGLGAESQRKSAPAGALAESPTCGTKKYWPAGKSRGGFPKVTSNSTSSRVTGPLPPELTLISAALDTEAKAVKFVLRTSVRKLSSLFAESSDRNATSEGELTRVGTLGVRTVFESRGKTR